MKPRKWKQGDPLSASRLNDMQDEAMRSRRSFSNGKGSSLVNETMGNQVGVAYDPGMRLVVANEDFAVSDAIIDLYPVNDPVPVARCMMMRVDLDDGMYKKETYPAPFYVWDPVAILTGSAYKVEGDVFYTVYNKDSKRWEVLTGGPGIRVVTATVSSCLGDGWHEVELCDWSGTPDPCAATGSASASVSASGSDASECDVCTLLPAESVENPCEDIGDVAIDRDNGIGTGEIVYAHTTRLMPMKVGGMIKMIKRAAPSLSASISYSCSASDDIVLDRLYDVVDGVWPLLSLPFPKYECCTHPVTGVQTVELVMCSRAVVEGYECPGDVTPCPTE